MVEPVPPENPKMPSASGEGLRWVLPVTILGSSMGFIDGSVVNVALPVMQWVINGYMLMLTSLILLGGSMGDRFGRKQVFMAGLVVFALASLACGVAPTAAWLIGARVGQGVGAALLVPASLAIIGVAYSEEERGKAIGTWSASAAIMTAVGPPLGGWLVDAVGWRSIFFINPPIAIVTLLLATKLPADRPNRSGGLDIPGAVLATIVLGLFCYGLIALGEGMRTVGIAALLASLPAGILFLLAEARAADPMMPLPLFRNRGFSGANGLTVLLYAALSGSLFMLPFMLIRVNGYTATAAGVAFLPFSVIMGAGSRWTGGLSDRLGARLPLIGGPLVTGCGFAWLALNSHAPAYWTAVFPGLVLIAVGMTFAIPPLTSTIFNTVPKEASGTASGINNAAARGGGLIAVAAIGLAFGGAAQTSDVSMAAVQPAYGTTMWTAAVLAVLSALCAAATISGKAPPKSPQTKKPGS